MRKWIARLPAWQRPAPPSADFAAKAEPLVTVSLKVWREKEQRWEEGPPAVAEIVRQ